MTFEEQRRLAQLEFWKQSHEQQTARLIKALAALRTIIESYDRCNDIVGFEPMEPLSMAINNAREALDS